VDEFATGLRKMGIGKGDVVLIDMPNIPQFIIAFYGIIRADAIANPVIPLNRFSEIAHQANDSKAKVLVIHDYLYEENLHGKDYSQFKSLQTIIMTGLGEYLPPVKRILGTALGKIPRMKNWPATAGSIKVRAFQDVLKNGRPIDLPAKRDINPREDTAVLIYTGGTTGTPKGVVSTHFNLTANCQQGYNIVSTQLPGALEKRGKAGMVCVLPLSHSFGLSVAMNMGYYFGYYMILFPRPPTPISLMLKEAAAQDAIFAPGVPTLWNRLNQDPKSPVYAKKLKFFKGCLSGAAPLPFEVKQAFEKMTGALITEGYGMSETSPLLCANPFNRARPNSVGLPVADTYFKIVDIDKGDKLLPQCTHTEPYCTEKCGSDGESRSIGEICGSGPQVMKGYLNRPEETAKVLRKDGKGVTWYFTSDIGCIDCEGYLRIKDRKRDMIKYKGHSVFPREVEDLLYAHPAILEVGVYGMKSKDPEEGEVIKAAISLKPEFKGKVTADDIMKWCKENISQYKYPRTIDIVEDLPKSIVGKVLRRVLREGDEQKAPAGK
jgi:long-chain acyl-CoA synthetase